MASETFDGTTTAAHNDRRVEELVASAGRVAMRLPPYSPDMNPIEKAIGKVKTRLRAAGERTVAGLFDAIGASPARVTGDGAAAYARSCG